MRIMKTILCSAAFAIGAATGAHANIVTYDFSITDSSHVVHDGSFSFDSSIIVDNSFAPKNELTSLSFNWGGVAYSTANANEGYLQFNAAGQLVEGCIGDRVSPFHNGCEVLTGNDWGYDVTGFFSAENDCGTLHQCSANSAMGPITSQVPEPSILALFGIAIAGAGLVVRKRQSKAHLSGFFTP